MCNQTISGRTLGTMPTENYCNWGQILVVGKANKNIDGHLLLSFFHIIMVPGASFHTRNWLGPLWVATNFLLVVKFNTALLGH